MVSFPPVSPPRPYTPPSPSPHAPHAQPISFFSILSPAQYWLRSTDHLAPRYAVSSIPPHRITYSFNYLLLLLVLFTQFVVDKMEKGVLYQVKQLIHILLK